MTQSRSSELFIGIDSGTQGTKAILFDADSGKILADAYASHDLTEDDKGKKEQDPEWWVQATRKVIGEILKAEKGRAGDIKGIGVSGQQHGLVVLDKKGNVIRPAKLWCDTETADQCNRITSEIGGEQAVIKEIGNAVAVGYTASKLLWLKEYEPEQYQKIETLLLPHDYLNYWLTGEKKTECGDASGTAYFDIRTRSWSDRILNAIDRSGKLQSCLPALISSDEPVGKIRPELVKEFGFNPELIVSSGGGDNMMAAIGTGNVADGIITASLGTSGTIYTCSSEPIVDELGELAAFCSSTGKWLPLVCTMNVTVSTELTRNLMGLSIEELNRSIAETEIGAGGILLMPYFNGERTPALPGATATFFGLNSTNYTPSNISRAAMEGPTYGLKYGLEVLQRNGISASEIRLVGGGAKSRIWRQMVADMFNAKVICPVSEEAGALGAALQAIWCYRNLQDSEQSIEEITTQYVALDDNKSAEPVPENVKRYSEIYQQYLAVGDALKRLYS